MKPTSVVALLLPLLSACIADRVEPNLASLDFPVLIGPVACIGGEPGGPADSSEQLNAAVEAAGGEAVINLDVEAGLPFWPDMLPGGLLLHWLPIWPGSVIVTIDGDIVRSKQHARRVERS